MSCPTLYTWDFAIRCFGEYLYLGAPKGIKSFHEILIALRKALLRELEKVVFFLLNS